MSAQLDSSADLRSGSTFDLWADDVPARAVRIVSEVWVAAEPAPRAEASSRGMKDRLPARR
jgi:hypothetical protein